MCFLAMRRQHILGLLPAQFPGLTVAFNLI